jgi:hypothetical protein
VGESERSDARGLLEMAHRNAVVEYPPRKWLPSLQERGSSGKCQLSGFQVVIGSHYDDTITGDGTSTISYETALTGVTVDLSMGTATGDGSDTLSGIANVTGSSHDDTITV